MTALQNLWYIHSNNLLITSIYDDVTVEFVVSGLDTPLAVASSTGTIVINIETDGSGDPVSTIGEVVLLINNTVESSQFIYAIVDNGIDPDTLCGAMSETAMSEFIVGYYYVGSHVEDNFRSYFHMDAIISNMVHVPYINHNNTWSFSAMMDPEPNPWI